MRKIYFLPLFLSFSIWSCSPADENKTGHEYMPDMAHPIAYEANVYGISPHNTWDKESTKSRRSLSIPGKPVAGTIPRGYSGAMLNGEFDAGKIDIIRGKNQLNAQATTVNGHVGFYYADNEEERLRATSEIIANPFPITAKGLEIGKELYNINCGICHGEAGDGAGYLVRDPDPAKGDPGGKYPAAPANFLLDDLINSSNGRYYYSIIYGKNVMGGYADKLSFEERWQVIHYIRSLQAVSKSLTYNEKANTLNAEFGLPQKMKNTAPNSNPLQ
jgi:mono/diheme cytochrome c family protein